MYDNLKAKYEVTKKFVMENQTPVACVATAIVSAGLMHRYDLESSRKLFYDLGMHHGLTAIQNVLMGDFIKDQGLDTEFRTFVDEVGEHLKDQLENAK